MHTHIDRVTIDWPVTDSSHIEATLNNIAELKRAHGVEHMDAIVRVLPPGNIAGQGTPGEIQAQLTEVLKTLKEIKMTDQETLALLGKVDATTNAIAVNQQTQADVVQEISDDIDRLIAGGTASGISPEAAAKLQAAADRLQVVSDTGDAQVALLKSIAAKSQPVVPPPPAPVDIP